MKIILCEICKGKKPNTVVETIEGKKIFVHSTKCLTIFNARKTSKVKKRRPLITMWEAKWEEDRYSIYHQRPCVCPKHCDEDKQTDIRYTEK